MSQYMNEWRCLLLQMGSCISYCKNACLPSGTFKYGQTNPVSDDEEDVWSCNVDGDLYDGGQVSAII